MERLYAHVQAPAVLHTVQHEPRLSVGGAVLLDPARAHELLHEADLAMYAVKTGSAPTRLVVTELRGHGIPVPRARAAEPCAVDERG